MEKNPLIHFRYDYNYLPSFFFPNLLVLHFFLILVIINAFFFSNYLGIFYDFVLIMLEFFLCFVFGRAIKITNFFSWYIF